MSERQPETANRTAPVTVIIPAYNGERFIRAAIESVQAQTLPVSEIIVVDDGSEDGTAEIVKEFGVILIQQPNQGVCAARNAGIRAASNPWVAFIDQDNLWEPQKIKEQWAAIELHTDAATVSCHMRWFADESIRSQDPQFEMDGGYGKENDGRIAYFPKVTSHLPFTRMIDYTSSLLVRRDVLLAAGAFNEELAQNEDLECFLRVVARSGLAIVRKPLVWHRVHDRNTSMSDPEGAVASYERVVDWLHQYPEKYPKGAAGAYDVALAHRERAAGRELLEAGRLAEARQLFRQSLVKAFSVRTALLWCLSFSPRVFKWLLSFKRRVFAKASDL
jgi:glycosyltransferase involved in cell wall biosynthesis